MNEVLYSIKKLKAGNTPDALLLDLADIAIGKGEFIVLCGPNGAGKTLFFRSLLGMIRHPENEIYWRGKKVNGMLNQARDAVSYVPQHPENHMLGMTVRQDILFSSKNTAIQPLLNTLEIANIADRPVIVLSGGEKRRVALAAALSTAPEMLLLDEPFMELDYSGVRDLTRILIDLKAAGTSIMLVTHDLSKVLALATRIMILNHGQLALDTAPQNIGPEVQALGIRLPAIPVADCTWLY